jgi:methylmalonyl-CoA mutase, C-terminal domain
VIALSILSGAHNVIVPNIMELSRGKPMTGVLVVLGGNVPTAAEAELSAQGVAEAFQPGAQLASIVNFTLQTTKLVA